MAVYQTATASFTTVGDTCVLAPEYAGSVISVTMSDCDDQRVQLQVEQGCVGSGSWRTVKEWNRTGASDNFTTVADSYFHRTKDRIRLFLHTDNGGTNTVVINEENDTRATIKANGVELAFDKFDVDTAGFIKPKFSVVDETASFTLNAQKHAGRVTRIAAAAGLTVTLPSSTGSGDEYHLLFNLDLTSNSYIVSCDTDAGAFVGYVFMATDGSGVPFTPDGINDLITLNGTTTGDGSQAFLTIKDIDTDFWLVTGFIRTTGAEATPFSGT